MSGETVVLVDSPDRRVSGLVEAAGAVARAADVPVALIGGLAVLCRVSMGQRATGDVDLVSDTQTDLVTPRSAADALVESGVAQRDPGSQSIRLWIGETKVEIIETEPVSAEDAASVEPERNRLFVLAHRWALESATPLEMIVRETGRSATLPVATPAALVAMKLHSIQDRTEDRKRASDAWDLYRLLDAHNRDGRLMGTFDAGPEGLADLVRAALVQHFGTAATRTRRWLVGYGDPRWAAEVTEEAMAELLEPFGP